MSSIAQEVLIHLQDHMLATLIIALVAGFAAIKAVAHGKMGNIVLFLILGLLGAFLGQFAIHYFDLERILDEIPKFRLFFDLIAAFIGSFVLASLVHFIKPL